TLPSSSTTGDVPHVRSAWNGSGELPALPHAARRRSCSRKSRLKNGSSETTQEACTFGYTTWSNCEPNAELSSKRSAPVTKTRLRQPICSWMKKPSEFCSEKLSNASFSSALLTRRTWFEIRPVPFACSDSKRYAFSCMPNDVSLEMSSLKSYMSV